MGERDATADSKAINKILDLPCWNRRAASAKVPGMNADPLSTWLGFLASPTAPKTAMSPMELDGYLTGIIVSPDFLLPNRWLAGLWGDDEPVFDDKDQLQTVLGAVMDRYNDLIAAMDAAFERIEAKEPFDYRPLFLAGGAKAKPDIVRLWARGFGKAMALGPEGWISLAEHERLQLLLAPFIGFLDIADPDFVPADDIDERLDEAAAVIPHATVVLRKLAQMRSAKPQAAAARGGKPGRNAPCPCGSGLKYKRCCGAN